VTPQALKIGAVVMIVGGTLAAIGALPLPYRYYEFLRAVVPLACGVGVLLLVGRRNGLVVVYVIAGLAFLLIKGLPKGLWALIDLGIAGLLVYGGIAAFQHSSRTPGESS